MGHHFQEYMHGTRVQTSALSMVGFALEGIRATEPVAVTAASQLGLGSVKCCRLRLQTCQREVQDSHSLIGEQLSE